MRDYADKDPDDVTAMFRIAYDVANRRCDVCERRGKAPVSKALRINGSVWGVRHAVEPACSVRRLLRRRLAAGGDLKRTKAPHSSVHAGVRLAETGLFLERRKYLGSDSSRSFSLE